MPPRARARQAGLALVSDLSSESFRPFLLSLAKKPKGGVEGVDELTRQQLTNVCAALEREVQSALEAAAALADEDMANEQEPLCQEEDLFMWLYGAAVLGLELLTRSKQPPPEELLSAATMLHDSVLMSAMDSETAPLQLDMQDAVMRLCCAWWERQLPGKEMLVARTIPYVLLRAVNDIDRSRSGMVHTCYVIREALELLDYEDETIADTKRLLLTAAMHPAFLRDAEGRRFVAGLFKLEPQMTRELVAIMRNQIASNMRSVLEPYGEILFRAWRDTIGPCAAEVESELQGLMQAAILASTPQLAKALRTVLNGMHSHKTLEKRVNPTLVRLYDPIMPRAFGAANAEVRRNALNLLVAAFPIIDPDAPAEENQMRLTQQLGFLLEGLVDPSLDVREAAVAGCCHCLKFYWEIIPAATSAKIISDITSKLVFDKASRAVRVASLHGLCALVDCQHAHPVLKKALPSVSATLLDKDPVVREAMADLLVAVAGCRNLQSAGVVPLEGLLATLARDTDSEVAKKISRILVPSYFSGGDEGASRVGALLRSQPEAGVALCRNIVSRFLADDQSQAGASRRAPSFTASVPTEQILQLAGDLVSHLLATVPQKKAAAAAAAVAAGGSGVTPPPKRPKARRGGKGAEGQGAAGKKRAKKDRAEAEEEREEEQEGENDNADGPQAEERDEDAVLPANGPETVAAWMAVLEGLLVLMQGLCAAVEKTQECSWEDVDAVVPGDTLIQLLKAAEENLGGYRAPSLVLQLAAASYFTYGAQSVRDLLFERLVDGTLPGLSSGSGDEVMELDGPKGPAPTDVGLLAQVLKTLATGNNTPRLLAILSAALGVREAQPIRKPAEKKKKKKADSRLLQSDAAQCLSGLDLSGYGHERDEGDAKEILCHGCRQAEPADTMLVCDGCENACHIHCLRPALAEVPEMDWFCWHCEAQLQAVRLPPAAAARCVSLVLSIEPARDLLLNHSDFSGMVKAMEQLALEEADSIAALAHNGDDSEADADSAPSGGYFRRSPEALEAEGLPGKLLGDPWGGLARYCRAALHRAMWATRPKEAEDGQAGKDADSETEADLPSLAATTPGTAARRQRRRRSTAVVASAGPNAEEAAEGAGELAGFYDLVSCIDMAVQMSVNLAELVMGEASLTAQVAALQYSQGLLRVLYIAQYLDLLTMGPDYVGMVAYLCTVLAVLARAAAAGLAQQPDGGTAAQKASVFAALRDILGLTKQMVAAVRVGTISGGGVVASTEGAGAGMAFLGGAGGPVTPGRSLLASAQRRPRSGVSARRAARGSDGLGVEGADDEDEELPSQQLEERMNEAAGGLRGQQRKSMGTAGEMPGGEQPERDGEKDGEGRELPPAVAVERLAVSLITLLCDPDIGGLLKSEVRVSAADLLGELLSATHKAEAGGWLDTLCGLTGEALLANPDTTAELRDILRSGAGSDAGEPAPAEAAEGDENAAENGGVRAAARKAPRGRGGKKEGAKVGAASQAEAKSAEQLSLLLKKVNPAVGTVANVLVRVCAAHKVFGRAMLLLARLAAQGVSQANPRPPAATDSAQAQPGDGGEEEKDAVANEGASALGAVVLLSLCRAEAPTSAAGPPAGNRRAAGRCGALAREAASKAAQADVEAAAKALGVLRQAMEEDRVLRPLQEQAGVAAAGELDDNGGGAEEQQGKEQARGLARCVARMLLQAAH